MFESITKRRKNPIINIFGWSLIAIVSVIFVFIGFSPSSNFLGSGGAAAEVNGDAISLRDFKELVDRLDENNNQANSNDRDARRKMQENAINILVSRSLIVQEAKDLNIFVSDKEVAEELLNIQPFYEDGAFSRIRYKTYLQQMRMTESEFESKLRRDLLIQKMSDFIGYSAKDLDMVEDFDKKIDQAKINVSYLSISPSQLATQAALSGSKLQDYISQNKEKIEQYFKNNASEFETKEQVKARHILVKAADESEAAMAKAAEKMKEVAAQTNTKNFSEMAKKFSDDPGSKNNGGDLGFFPRGRMVPEFENAAFNGKVGEISQPVKTKYGYHIVLVDAKEEGKKAELKDVEAKIALKLNQENRFDEVLSKLRSELESKNYDGINKTAEENQLKWKDTGFFSITRENIPGIGEHKEFLETALSLNENKPYADKMVRKGDTAFIVKYKEAKLDTAEPANPQMDIFKQFMKQQKMNMAVQGWTESLRKKASVRINTDLIQ